MRIGHSFLVGLTLACAGLSSQSQIRIQLPNSLVERIPSPDGRFALIGQTRRVDQSARCAGCFGLDSKLWLEEVASGKRRLVLVVSSSAAAAWSPDGRYFYVEDRETSDAGDLYLYEASSMKRTDILRSITAADPEAKRFLNGHRYIEAVQWQSRAILGVDLNGHTDGAPVECFDFHYKFNVSGMAEKLSKKVGSPEEKWCKF